MTPPRPQAANVDDYIAAFEPSVQAILSQIRATVRQAAPQASETISYGMPALKMRGVLIYFAAFKHHIGFYPPIRGDAALAQEAVVYAGPKGNLKFPYTQPMPYALMAALTRLRAEQDAGQRRRPAPAQGARSTDA
jgi:uncharacterized protein YdhG (YjbR/CyaY superfamily)